MTTSDGANRELVITRTVNGSPAAAGHPIATTNAQSAIRPNTVCTTLPLSAADGDALCRSGATRIASNGRLG